MKNIIKVISFIILINGFAHANIVEEHGTSYTEESANEALGQ